MTHANLITKRNQFLNLCRRIRDAGLVAFDTEFVSEHTYRPELGLLQFGLRDQCETVDPYKVGDLTPWWEMMADRETTVVVHGGQAEIRFCLTLHGLRPHKLIDVQLAEGFCSGSYPVSYSSLVRNVLGKRLKGGETRTDWRKRPLSQKQLEYALEDVRYLLRVWDEQRKQLEERGRLEWVAEEFERMVTDIENDLNRDVWPRLPGIAPLAPRELAVVRELAQWREQEADRTNRPPRRILRDDLLVELGRRQPRSKKDLLRTRDMNRPAYRKHAEQFLQCIDNALALPESECPEPPRKKSGRPRIDDRTLSQFLGLVLGHRCAELNLSKQIVATAEVLKQFVRWHINGRQGRPPRLADGWRAAVCGDLLTDILEGRLSVRVGDPTSRQPLLFEHVTGR